MEAQAQFQLQRTQKRRKLRKYFTVALKAQCKVGKHMRMKKIYFTNAVKGDHSQMPPVAQNTMENTICCVVVLYSNHHVQSMHFFFCFNIIIAWFRFKLIVGEDSMAPFHLNSATTGHGTYMVIGMYCVWCCCVCAYAKRSENHIQVAQTSSVTDRHPWKTPAVIGQSCFNKLQSLILQSNWSIRKKFYCN